jgi:hypothetical protein
MRISEQGYFLDGVERGDVEGEERCPGMLSAVATPCQDAPRRSPAARERVLFLVIASHLLCIRHSRTLYDRPVRVIHTLDTSANP